MFGVVVLECGVVVMIGQGLFFFVGLSGIWEIFLVFV